MKVSIIIPVFNVSDYVERCLSSVMTQTYTNLECIIVDDCSPDDSIEKCERMIVGYDGPIAFKILHHERNRGLSAARNTGTDAATGEYIYYLDSDDWIFSYCIELLLKAAQNDTEIEVVIGNYKHDSNTKFPQLNLPSSIYVKDLLNKYLQGDYYMMAWNKLYRTDFIRINKLSFVEGLIHEDITWSFCCACLMKKMAVVNEITYYYNIRKGSIQTINNSIIHDKNYGLCILEEMRFIIERDYLCTKDIFLYIVFSILSFLNEHINIQKWFYYEIRRYPSWSFKQIKRISNSRKLQIIHIHRFLPKNIGKHYLLTMYKFLYQ